MTEIEGTNNRMVYLTDEDSYHSYSLRLTHVLIIFFYLISCFFCLLLLELIFDVFAIYRHTLAWHIM